MLIHNPNDLALMLKARRKHIDFSQSQAANLIGLKQNTISAFERHPSGTKIETLFRMLSALGLEMHIVPKNSAAKGKDEW